MAMTAQDDENALPPLPHNHGFAEGDRVSIPVYGRKKILGTVTHIDITFKGRRYKGLAVLGDDGSYYELSPEIATKIP